MLPPATRTATAPAGVKPAHIKGARKHASQDLRHLLDRGGLVVAIVLLVAGGLLMWGHNFANSNVHSQLAQQQITFPPATAFAHAKAGTEITPSWSLPEQVRAASSC